MIYFFWGGGGDDESDCLLCYDYCLLCYFLSLLCYNCCFVNYLHYCNKILMGVLWNSKDRTLWIYNWRVMLQLFIKKSYFHSGSESIFFTYMKSKLALFLIIQMHISYVLVLPFTAMDISSDLVELGRTPVTVISAGVKSILDISRTLEYLVPPFSSNMIINIYTLVQWCKKNKFFLMGYRKLKEFVLLHIRPMSSLPFSLKRVAAR